MKCFTCTHFSLCSHTLGGMDMKMLSEDCWDFEAKELVDKDKFIDQLNGILKDHFDYVPLNTTLKIAQELIEILPKNIWIEQEKTE